MESSLSSSLSSKREYMSNEIKIKKYTLNSLAALTSYLDKCITDLNYLQDDDLEISDMYYDLIYEFSIFLLNNLEVKNYHEFKQIENYIRRADIVLDSSFQDKNPGSIISSFDKLKRNLIKLKVLTQ